MTVFAIIAGLVALAALGLVIWFVVGLERAANRNDN